MNIYRSTFNPTHRALELESTLRLLETQSRSEREKPGLGGLSPLRTAKCVRRQITEDKLESRPANGQSVTTPQCLP